MQQFSTPGPGPASCFAPEWIGFRSLPQRPNILLPWCGFLSSQSPSCGPLPLDTPPSASRPSTRSSRGSPPNLLVGCELVAPLLSMDAETLNGGLKLLFKEGMECLAAFSLFLDFQVETFLVSVVFQEYFLNTLAFSSCLPGLTFPIFPSSLCRTCNPASEPTIQTASSLS